MGKTRFRCFHTLQCLFTLELDLHLPLQCVLLLVWKYKIIIGLDVKNRNLETPLSTEIFIEMYITKKGLCKYDLGIFREI